jgi:hypothetical protein
MKYDVVVHSDVLKAIDLIGWVWLLLRDSGTDVVVDVAEVRAFWIHSSGSGLGC